MFSQQLARFKIETKIKTSLRARGPPGVLGALCSLRILRIGRIGSGLWTHVNLVLSSLLQIDWSVNPSLCLLNDDSGLCISSMQKRILFAGFTAVKKTIIQNWFTPHMCRKTYWIHSLLQIVTYECTTARVGGVRPSTIDAWQCYLFDIRDCIEE